MSDDKRSDQHRRDLENLMLQPQFHRFLYTVFESCSMFGDAYGSDGRHLPYMEGRRSLGFDILRGVERIDPNAMLAVLTAESQALKETPDGRSNRYDPADERAEPDGPVGAEGRKPGTGLIRYELVDYSKPVASD